MCIVCLVCTLREARSLFIRLVATGTLIISLYRFSILGSHPSLGRAEGDKAHPALAIVLAGHPLLAGSAVDDRAATAAVVAVPAAAASVPAAAARMAT